MSWKPRESTFSMKTCNTKLQWKMNVRILFMHLHLQWEKFSNTFRYIWRYIVICYAIHLQIDLDTLSACCKRNKLDLNIEKCKVMSFYRKKTRVKLMQDIGVWFDEELTYNRHLDLITSKAYSMLGFMMRICKQFTNVQALKSVYFAHVRCYLEYASIVWHPYHLVHINKIESIQKKFFNVRLEENCAQRPEFSSA